MRTKELREKSTDELVKELHALRKEQFNLRMQKSSGNIQKTHLMSMAKVNIARIKTILLEKGVRV